MVKQHADHLVNLVKEHHGITDYWEGKKYLGIDLTWDYKKSNFRSTMNRYIQDIRIKYDHQDPNKPQLYPHAHRPITYGAKQQMALPEDTSVKLDSKGIKHVQGIVGALIFVGRAVNNKVLVALSAIGSQKSAATENTNAATTQILNYVANYPDYGLLLRASDMILAAHLYASFLNESKARIRAGDHLFLSGKLPTPPLNGDVLTIAQIIKSVMESSA